MRILTTLFILVGLSSYGQNGTPVKLGLGIVAIKDTYDESKTVTIYKDKELRIKIEDFKLFGGLKRVWPYYFKPDYGLCYFVCLEKAKGYFKILINDKEEGFLKNGGDRYFKTWETLLINNSVEVLDLKSNPHKSQPSVKAETIALSNKIPMHILQVRDVREINGEHWIEVNYSKNESGPCDSSMKGCATGWIKWRVGDKLLVDILLLC